MGRARNEDAKTDEIKQKENEDAKNDAKKTEIEYIIEVKNKLFTGTAANVQFKNGIGVTKNELLADYFKARGANITKK